MVMPSTLFQVILKNTDEKGFILIKILIVQIVPT